MTKQISGCFCLISVCFLASCIRYPTSPDGTGIEGGYEGARSVTMGSPAGDRIVPEGTLVTISWASYNDTDVDATLTIVAEGQATLTTTTVTSGVSIAADSGAGSGSVVWDTAGLDGQEYEIHAVLVADGVAESNVMTDGNITVDAAPEFTLTGPTSDAQLAVGGTLIFEWTGVDTEGAADVRIGLDVDNDHVNGNEIYIHEDTLAEEETDDAFTWDGEDTGGSTVGAGTYRLFIIVDDSVNAVQVIEGNVNITVN